MLGRLCRLDMLGRLDLNGRLGDGLVLNVGLGVRGVGIAMDNAGTAGTALDNRARLRGPLGRLASRDALGVHLVNLFEREALGFINKEVDKGNADKAAAEPDEEDLGLEVGIAGAKVDEVGGRVGDGPVEQPVGGGRQGKAAGTVLEREDFAGDDPAQRAPSRSKEEDVDAHKGNAGLLGIHVMHENVTESILGGGGGAEHGNNQLADAHTDGAAQQQGAATPALHGPETGESGDDVDAGHDHLDDKGVADARVGEILGAIVKYKVDARQLLQGLQSHTGKLALAHGLAEAVQNAKRLAGDLLLLVVDSNLVELHADRRVGRGQAADLAEGTGGLFVALATDEVAGRLGKHEHSTDKDQGPGKLDGNGNAVGAGVLALVGGVVDDGGEQEADGDGELVASDDGTADPLGSRLSLVEGDYV